MDLGLLAGLGQGVTEGINNYVNLSGTLQQRKTAQEDALARRKQAVIDEAFKKAQITDLLGSEGAAQLLGGGASQASEEQPAWKGLLADNNKTPSGLVPNGLVQQPEQMILPKSEREARNKATELLFAKDPVGKTMTTGAGRLYEIHDRDLTEKEKMDREKEGLDLESKRLGIKKSQKELNTEKAGKILPAVQTAEMGSAESSVAALNDVSDLFKQNSSIVGPGQGLVSGIAGSLQAGDTGKRAAILNSQLQQRAQIIGKYLESGKLAEGDIKRYLKMLPNLRDAPEVAQGKINSLNRLIAQKQQADLSNFSNAGYDTSNIRNIPISDFSSSKASSQNKPTTVIQNGHTYTLNPQTGNYE